MDGLINDLVNKGKTDDSGTVEDWVNESHGLAVSVGYKYPGFKTGKIPSTKVPLGQAYVNKAKPVVDLHLARGGVRLARMTRHTVEPASDNATISKDRRPVTTRQSASAASVVRFVGRYGSVLAVL